MAGISITIGGNFTKLDELKNRANKTADSIKSAFGSKLAKTMFAGIAAGGAAAFAGVAIAAKKAVADASDLSEVMSKTKVVFGESADQMIEWAATASRTFGQSKQQALDAASGFGNLFVSMGLVGPVAATMSRTMTELASDLASFNNTSVEDAILAIGSALRGEMEPMTRFGVLLNDATLKAKALAMGLSNGKDTLGPAIKAQAAYALMLEQTSTAQGDFMRTSDGLANSQRTIAALFADLSASVGEQLLPTMQQFAATIKEIDFDEVGKGIGSLVSYMGSLASMAGTAFGAIEPLISLMKRVAPTLGMFEKYMENMGFADKSLSLGEQPAYRPPSKRTAPPPATAAPSAEKDTKEREKATKAAEKKAEADKKAADEKAKSRSAAQDEYNMESAILSARLAGDAKRLESLEREKKIREEIARLESAGFTSTEARGPATAKVDAETKADAADKAKDKAETERQKTEDILRGKLDDTLGKNANRQFESTIGAATSMQRIGGGGGAVSSGLDYARQTADLQREANDLTRQLIAIMKPEPSV
jgi:hypothetical protein